MTTFVPIVKQNRMVGFGAIGTLGTGRCWLLSAFSKLAPQFRPIGSKAWLAEMEAKTGLTLAPQKRGPKGKAGEVAA